jgi:hypothetical protein
MMQFGNWSKTSRAIFTSRGSSLPLCCREPLNEENGA